MFDRPIPYFLEQYLGEPEEVVRDWPGLESPLLVMFTYAVYAIVLIYGRRCMKSLQPFKLKGILICYNLEQIILNAYILIEVISSVSTGHYSLWCSPSYGMKATTRRLARATWLFYLSKIIDMMDTVFFTLRKKDEQITFLHVYHHVATLMAWYLGALYTPTDQGWLSISINAAIHVLMYLYYLVSALGPKYQKYLWWKRYLTQFQLVQFFIVCSQLSYLVYNGCARPMWLAQGAVVYYLSLIILFMGFYGRAYSEKNEKTNQDEILKSKEESERWVDQKNEDKKRS